MNIYNDYNNTYNDFLNMPAVPATNNDIIMNDNQYGPYEGYVKGNLFKDLYNPYKNYQPEQLIPNNEQEEALLNLNQMGFAMHEMNLLLDVYPNDQNAMREFDDYRNKYNEQMNHYQEKYEALNVNSDSLKTTPFGWVEEAWPFNRRDS